jgi:hypothetical protein
LGAVLGHQLLRALGDRTRVRPVDLLAERCRACSDSELAECLDDAAFLARAGAAGLVRGSFVPDQPVRELRDLTRRRTEVIRAAGQEVQRLEKQLEDIGMKVSSVLSNIVGTSGRDILEALIASERDPNRLADLARGKARRKTPELIEHPPPPRTDPTPNDQASEQPRFHRPLRPHSSAAIRVSGGILESEIGRSMLRASLGRRSFRRTTATTPPASTRPSAR